MESYDIIEMIAKNVDKFTLANLAMSSKMYRNLITKDMFNVTQQKIIREIYIDNVLTTIEMTMKGCTLHSYGEPSFILRNKDTLIEVYHDNGIIYNSNQFSLYYTNYSINKYIRLRVYFDIFVGGYDEDDRCINSGHEILWCYFRIERKVLDIIFVDQWKMHKQLSFYKFAKEISYNGGTMRIYATFKDGELYEYTPIGALSLIYTKNNDIKRVRIEIRNNRKITTFKSNNITSVNINHSNMDSVDIDHSNMTSVDINPSNITSVDMTSVDIQNDDCDELLNVFNSLL